MIHINLLKENENNSKSTIYRQTIYYSLLISLAFLAGGAYIDYRLRNFELEMRKFEQKFKAELSSIAQKHSSEIKDLENRVGLIENYLEETEGTNAVIELKKYPPNP